MPIILTNKWNAGSAGNGAEYSEAKIIEFRLGLENTKYAMMCVEFGDTIDGKWVRGVTGHFQVVIEDTPEDPAYSIFLGQNLALVDQVGAVLYAKLQAMEPVKMAGTVTS